MVSICNRMWACGADSDINNDKKPRGTWSFLLLTFHARFVFSAPINIPWSKCRHLDSRFCYMPHTFGRFLCETLLEKLQVVVSLECALEFKAPRLHISLEMIPMPTTTLLNLGSICLLTPPTVCRLLPQTAWYSRVSHPKNLTRFKGETAPV
jgi:hypothetical protein